MFHDVTRKTKKEKGFKSPNGLATATPKTHGTQASSSSGVKSFFKLNVARTSSAGRPLIILAKVLQLEMMNNLNLLNKFVKKSIGRCIG
uniref:Uncharacterized protein n=1 Tax=Romanomermis culicivorax TaxID=13658 RepID=A0A915K202_ROMCU